MNMHNTIIKGIAKNLEQSNFLVLPNFGAFIIHNAGAHIQSQEKQVIFPPQKKVSFNSQIKQNDGVLANWLSIAINCTLSEATEKLLDFSEYCTSLLNAKSRITLEGIGFFYKDLENNLCFEPNEHNNLQTESFGLAPLNLNVIETDSKEIVNRIEKVDKVVGVDNKVVRNNTRYQKLILPLLIVVLLTSLLSIALTNNTISGVIKASVFSSSEVEHYNKINYVDLSLKPFESVKSNFVSNSSGYSVIKIGDDKLLAVNMNSDVSSIASEDKTFVSKNYYTHTKSKNKFNIVVGCFSILSNAKKMINQLNSKNIEGFVNGKNNKEMFVVCAGSFSNKENALEKLALIKESYPNAWIKSEE